MLSSSAAAMMRGAAVRTRAAAATAAAAVTSKRGVHALAAASNRSTATPARPTQASHTSQVRLFSSSAEDSADADADNPLNAPREAMEYDVVIVGAGPAGLAAAIRLKQQAEQAGRELSVCVVEKGAEVGSHILSGNVFDPIALDELLPNWRDDPDCPVKVEVKEDKLLFLTETRAIPLPTPPSLQNHGNYMISLSQLARWLGAQAEAAGVEIYPGFAASEVLYDAHDGSVQGIATKDVGIGRDGKPKDTFARGMELRAKHTLFAEGTRGSLSEKVMERFNLRKDADPQTYGLGVKEIWEVPADKFKPGLVQHTIGWPSPSDTWSGSFVYHFDDNKVLLGVVVGLDYSNTYISPYQEMQKFKTHPIMRDMLEGGKILEYGARCINEGGYQSIPKLTFPGGSLIGCSAGFLNVPRIKGTHTAMKSGMVAADSIVKSLVSSGMEGADALVGAEVRGYQRAMENSWVYKELHKVRNVHPSYHKFGGLYGWMIYSGLQTFLFRGHEPWTFRNALADHERTKPADQCTPIEYPKPDGVLTFDLLTNLQRSAVKHTEDQPSHLRVKAGMERAPVDDSWAKFRAPETRFCPAKVYEIIVDEAEPANTRLQINHTNCVHCKSCAIKTPGLYIDWTVPEGGGGPN